MSWTIKKAEHWRTDAFNLCCWRGFLRVPWTARKLNPVNAKGNQPWIFIRRTYAEASILWPPDAKSRHTGKDPDAGKDWRQEEKGTTEDGMVGWHHRFNGHEFEQALGDGEGQGSLACCNSKASNTTEQLNNMGFPVTIKTVKTLPAMQETGVQFLGQSWARLSD